MMSKKMKVLIGCCVLSCSIFSVAHAAVIPNCPSAASVKNVPLDTADSDGQQYIAATGRFVRFDGRHWLVAIGMFDADNQQDAISKAKKELQMIRSPLTSKAVLIESDNRNWWTCMYPSSKPDIIAIAFSPEKEEFNSKMSSQKMMDISR